ncbi:serpentine type 7TM GPCR chemoreceptor srt domain-containing protein [Ditylenchus destructor]|uniref:Serpentine type 7TM GPCR chemoreceptor srt domain-containing protein n=1 Tax=Ditylenchus destructor TaxID=166010 RepID=A0AAD4MH94_9BILA|nr:serpentine type 7TM GPCR chemoreceptor srt domain-containing protein [Ditylenchus destructor]
MVPNPHAGYIDDSERKYTNLHGSLYNMSIFCTIIGLYLTFAYLLISQRNMLRKGGTTSQVVVAQRKSLIQALVICSCGAISDAYFTFILSGSNLSPLTAFLGMVTWICCHGTPGLIYVSMNKTLRNSILGMVDVNTLWSSQKVLSISQRVQHS